MKNSRFYHHEAQENPEEEGPQEDDEEISFPDCPPALQKGDNRRMTFSPWQWGHWTILSFEFQIIFSKVREQSEHWNS